jgi:hypothetical protein
VFGCAYERIADESCSATTLRRRRDEWIEAGSMETLEEMALESYDRIIIGLERSEVAVDCCITKASSQTLCVAVDAEGIPLGVIAAPANRHDSSPLLSETLDTARESCRSRRAFTSTAPTSPKLPESFWRAVPWSARSPRKASPPRCKPQCGGWGRTY